MEDMVDTDSAATEPTTLATVMEAMARGLLTLRLMPTTAMEDMVLAFMESPPCVNAANIPVPCTYGKRSADSDAYYGYGGAYTGLGYGGYGYGGLGYGYGK